MIVFVAAVDGFSLVAISPLVEAEEVHGRAAAAQFVHHRRLLTAALLRPCQDVLGFVGPDDDDAAFVGDDQVAWPDGGAAARSDHADSTAGVLGGTPQRSSAGEDGKAQAPDCAEITHGPV